MRKSNKIYHIYGCILLASLLGLMGCANGPSPNEPSAKLQKPEIESFPNEIQEPEKISQITEAPTEEMQEKITAPTIVPTIEETDWTDYFDGINGAAVIYNPASHNFRIYHPKLALTRRSPCSTFKIISSLIALEYGIIEPANSVHTWSGEIFWNENWNRDIDFPNAFQSSCVWYFREVIDEIGADIIAKELENLQYGNCDISDWEGHLNTNNNNPALTGFWLESSLLISPKEQVEVMERIFGDDTDFSEETISQLKQVMLLEEENNSHIKIYGKTGMGKAQGIVVDSWFTGFADTTTERIYFCVYLGETDNKNVSSAQAKEIAVKLVSDYLN